MTWRCAWCGREYEEKDPPCGTCGHETFERAGAEGGDSPFDSESYVWVCSNCGREHVKNVKLCSRCSQPALEKQATDDGRFDDELEAPGYLSVGWPYLAGVAVVLAVVALALAGVVPVPGLGGPPAPPDAPGEADRAAGIELAAVEDGVHERFAEERGRQRSRNEGLDALAAYLVAHEVATVHDPAYDGDLPDASAFDPGCGGPLAAGTLELDLAAADYDSAAALAAAVGDELLAMPDYESVVTDDRSAEAVALHVAPNDAVFVSYAAC